ncbi:10332_t:CDS:2 [Dentiscutata erythropus]|uniref:10332_t:CDS:1 n=1 Tax=Dentiscutata erythropus TaxID=1348616 RepID=A0A9N9AD33_9GLOM|nr:10332_t:CDS:2 [Dentiscutata erythropus]
MVFNLFLFTFFYITITISTVLGQTVPIDQTTPNITVQGSPAQPNDAASPIATGDISICTTCDEVKVACGSKFNLPKVNSQGTYIASNQCYCSYDVYNSLSQCLICYNGANVGNSTLDSLDDWNATCTVLGSSLDQNNTTQSNQPVVQPTNNNNNATDSSDENLIRAIGFAGCVVVLVLLFMAIVIFIRKRKHKWRKIEDYNPDISKPTKSLDLVDDYKQTSQEYDQYDDETIGQAILPVAAAPEIITIIPEVHIIDENSIVDFSDNIIDSQLQQQQYYYSSEQQQHIVPNGNVYYSSEPQQHMDPNGNIYYI